MEGGGVCEMGKEAEVRELEGIRGERGCERGRHDRGGKCYVGRYHV